MLSFRIPPIYLCTINLKETIDMNKVIEFIAKVLDDGETNSEKEIKLPSFKIEKINMRLFITTSWFIPLAGAIAAGILMDVNSREYRIVTLPLLINTLIILILFLHNIIKESNFTKRQLALIFGIPLLAIFWGMILFSTNSIF